jgi:hypothetical protein
MLACAVIQSLMTCSKQEMQMRGFSAAVID